MSAVESRLRRGVDAATEVMVVEDSELDIMLLEVACDEIPGMPRVGVVIHGLDALAALDALDPLTSALRTLIIDLNTPPFGGFEVLRAVRRHPRWSRLRVCVFSASVLDSDAAESRAQGADDYVVKPIGWDAFGRAFAALCGVGAERVTAGTEITDPPPQTA